MARHGSAKTWKNAVITGISGMNSTKKGSIEMLPWSRVYFFRSYGFWTGGGVGGKPAPTNAASSAEMAGSQTLPKG